MKLGFSPDDQRAWIEKHRPTVEQKVGAPVIAFLPFHRSGAMGAMAVSRISPLAASAIRLVGKKKAGGLPQTFYLVLTADRIYAYTSKTTRSSFELKNELAVWERAAIRVSTKENTLDMQLTIESPAEGEKVVCQATKSAVTGDFFAHLGGSTAVAA
jgi:hypothetical protein